MILDELTKYLDKVFIIDSCALISDNSQCKQNQWIIRKQ